MSRQSQHDVLFTARMVFLGESEQPTIALIPTERPINPSSEVARNLDLSPAPDGYRI